MGTAANKGSTQIRNLGRRTWRSLRQTSDTSTRSWTLDEERVWFGKPVERLPSPNAKDLPIIQGFEFPSLEQALSSAANPPKEVPTDLEYLRLIDDTSAFILISPGWRVWR